MTILVTLGTLVHAGLQDKNDNNHVSILCLFFYFLETAI